MFGKQSWLLFLFGLTLLVSFSHPDRAFPSDSAGPVVIPDGGFRAAILMNADTGEVLYQKNPHLSHPPASMVKMMLMLLVMEKLEIHSVSLSDPVTTSARASKIGGSQVYLKHGEVFPLEEMMKAVVIHSANDASLAIAEFLTGSAEGTVDLMNRRAVELGMKGTLYHSVDGLPPGKGEKPDLSTAYDLALLARELIQYPKLLEWCSTQTAPFRGGEFVLSNTNKLVGRFPGADGIKTGYFREAGYNLTATASREGLRMIAVVLDLPSDKVRMAEAARLLSVGFNMYNKVRVVQKGEAVASDVRVLGAKEKVTALVAADDIFVHVRRGAESSLHREVAVPGEITAPVVTGESYGQILIKNGDREIAKVNAVAQKAIPQAPLCYRVLYRFF